MTTTTPMNDPDELAVDALYEALFGVTCEEGTLESYRETSRRIALVEKAVTRARDEQAITVAWWWHAGQTYAKLAETIGNLSASRVQQIVERGRKLARLPAKRKQLANG